MNGSRHHALLSVALLPAALLTLAHPASAAFRIQSPAETLSRPENTVAVVRAIAPGESGTYRFEVKKVLHGETTGELAVRMEPETIARTVTGDRYILGFTDLLSNPMRKGTFTVDPLGPRVVRLDDAGLALVEDTKPIRRLLVTAGSDDPGDADRAVSSILRQLVGEEAAARRFVAAELHMRRGLSECLSADAGGPMDTAWRWSSEQPQTRYHLLSVAEAEVGTLGPDRLGRYAREVLDAHGRRLELTSYDPLLVLTAARALGGVGRVEDLPRLEKHLYSNNTGIPKAVLPSMVAIDREAALAAAERALASENLNPETRRVLEAHRKREGTEPSELE